MVTCEKVEAVINNIDDDQLKELLLAIHFDNIEQIGEEETPEADKSLIIEIIHQLQSVVDQIK